MPLFRAAIAEAFASAPLSGNPAGVVVLGRAPFPEDALAIRIAAELRHSETAFVRDLGGDEFALRYFIPVCEAALCGHATVAAFTLLRDKLRLAPGEKLVHTPAGDITVFVEPRAVRLEMAEAKVIRELNGDEARALYRAYALKERGSVLGLAPAIVSVGLADIMLPVEDEAELASARQDAAAVAEISRALGVTGVHMFALTSGEFTAHTRNFAPLYGIDEECATGTASGGLFHLLHEKGLVSGSARFMQGEAMGRPSVIEADLHHGRVRVGGPGAVLLYGNIRMED